MALFLVCCSDDGAARQRKHQFNQTAGNAVQKPAVTFGTGLSFVWSSEVKRNSIAFRVWKAAPGVKLDAVRFTRPISCQLVQDEHDLMKGV